MLDICLLGTGGMMPLPDRWLTSLLARCQGEMVLIDCGEGTQIPMRMSDWGFVDLSAICFTHYHADHIAGLPGLLLTIGNSGRIKPIVMAGPPGLRKVVEALRVVAEFLPFDVHYFELSDVHSETFVVGSMEITTLPVEHTDPCLAYRIDVKRKGRFDAQKAQSLGIPVEYWNPLQKGEKVWMGERLIFPDEVMGPERKGIRVSYCTDSRPVPGLVDFVKGSDLFVCEGMYSEDSYLEKAILYKHMLFSEAARLAFYGEVKELWLTHFSPSLTAPEDDQESVKAIFENTVVGKGLMKTTYHYPDPE